MYSFEQEYLFVGVGYWQSMPERLPGLFRNPMDADDITFAQIRLFVPRNRLIFRDDRLPNEVRIFRQRHSQARNLLNQHWTVQLVPATSSSIPFILETTPPNIEITVPSLGGISVEEFRRLNTH